MKRLAITMGDAGGIGPEVALKAARLIKSTSVEPVIIGDKRVMEEVASLTGLSLDVKVADVYPLREFKRGKPDKQSGKAAYEYIKHAVEGCLKGRYHAMVTAPISKEALHLAGLRWPGHTELIASLTDTKEYAMMLMGGPLRVLLVTTHLPLRKVPELITKELLLSKFRLALRASEMLGIERPRIGVAGLNPHAGEAGVLGSEELEVIIPAIKGAQDEGIPLSGPYPPDIIFYKAYRGELDILVCMYHDQGLAPLKMIAFDRGVNLTVGLPIIRTSPDHGTAYDIAWKAVADPTSMVEACRVALSLRV
ncbi:MAG: 4-hydroxythreonine-4-phosphate dehydrogenase PdxA [Nitrospirae bacterium]|nr:MAG: 4-hydroxythreonine-4-phosphate dehydrogenase PdxA [Nitrospirota bacterium]